MTEKNKLNEEQLEQVSGGGLQDVTDVPGKSGKPIWGTDTEEYIGKTIVAVDVQSDGVAWAIGTLIGSWDKSCGCNSHMRVHEINVTDFSKSLTISDVNKNVVNSNKTYQFNDAFVSLYEFEYK